MEVRPLGNAGENVAGKYISQTYWRSKADFEGWATGPAFAASHGGSKSEGSHGGGGAGSSGGGGGSRGVMGMLEGLPSPEFYETVTITE